MNAVYCSLPVVADDVTGSKEIDVFLSTLLQRTEKGIQCLILVLYLLGNPGVKRRVGKERVFHEKDRRIGMLAADSGIEFIGTLSHLLHGSIGHKVEDKHRSVHTGYDIGNLQVEQGIAAKSQIDALTIEPTFQNIWYAPCRDGKRSLPARCWYHRIPPASHVSASLLPAG